MTFPSANGRTGTYLATAPTLTELRDIPSYEFQSGDLIALGGAYSVGDVSGGLFWWSADAVEFDDNLTVIQPSDRDPASPGRWLLTSGTNGLAVVNGKLYKTPEDYRLPGDDDATAIQRLFNALGSVNGRIDRPYVVDRPLTISDRQTFELVGVGSIKAKAGMPLTIGGFGAPILTLRNCQWFTIAGLTIDGNRSNRVPAEVYAHNLVVGENCRDGTIDVRSINAVCDGAYLGVASAFLATPAAYPQRLAIRIDADNSFRQGMSIIQGRDLDIYGRYNNSNGTAPQAGIDVEPNTGDPNFCCDRLRFHDVEMRGNVGYGFSTAGTTKVGDITLNRPRFIDNTAGAAYMHCQSFRMTDPFFSGFTNAATRAMVDIPATPGAGHGVILRPVVRNVTATTNAHPLFYVHSVSDGYVEVIGLDVDSCGAVASFNAAHCLLLDAVRIRPNLSISTAAIAITGADCEVSRNFIVNFRDSVIYADTTATGIVIDDNLLTEPVANNSAPIFCGVKALSFQGNKVRRATSATGYGIQLNAGADHFHDNIVEGFTGAPYQIIGTLYSASGNIANGQPVAEVTLVVSTSKSIADGGEAFLGTVSFPAYLTRLFPVAFADGAPGFVLSCGKGATPGSTAVYGRMVAGAGSYTVPAGTVITVRLTGTGA